MMRRPPRSPLDRSSAASDVYKRQDHDAAHGGRPSLGVVAGRPVVPDELAITATHQKADGVTRAPVSYTHLRAHEPALDIVCRLLLAKNEVKNANTVLYALTEQTVSVLLSKPGTYP